MKMRDLIRIVENKNDIEWFALDPKKADHGAKFGAYVSGCTLLELPGGKTFVVTGVCSTSSRKSAEEIARKSEGPQDKDRYISRAKLLSWKA